MNVKKPVENFVSPFFLKLAWEAQYHRAPEPVRGYHYWMNNSYGLITAPPIPKQPGRGKGSKNHNRIKGKLESPKKKKKKTKTEAEDEVEVEVLEVSRKGRVMHCRQCGEPYHNSATCKKFPKEKATKASNKELHEYLCSLSQAASSQVASSQVSSSQAPQPTQATQPSQQEDES